MIATAPPAQPIGTNVRSFSISGRVRTRQRAGSRVLGPTRRLTAKFSVQRVKMAPLFRVQDFRKTRPRHQQVAFYGGHADVQQVGDLLMFQP